MLSTEEKKKISAKIQAILQEINDDELPDGEINFILHIDGKEAWSWANIRNSSQKDVPVPETIVKNLSV
jgi:hypothetical protein